MQTVADQPLIVRAWKFPRVHVVIFLYFLLINLPLNIQRFVKSPDVGNAGMLSVALFTSLAGAVFALDYFRRARTPIVVIDGFGISNIFKGSDCPLPWSCIEACACLHDERRRILRIFLRQPDPHRDIPKARQTSGPEAKTYFDIDFCGADKSEQALDDAVHACARWIAATGVSSVASYPISEFVDGPPPPRWKNWLHWAAIVVGISIASPLLIYGGPLLLMWLRVCIVHPH